MIKMQFRWSILNSEKKLELGEPANVTESIGVRKVNNETTKIIEHSFIKGNRSILYESGKGFDAVMERKIVALIRT